MIFIPESLPNPGKLPSTECRWIAKQILGKQSPHIDILANIFRLFGVNREVFGIGEASLALLRSGLIAQFIENYREFVTELSEIKESLQSFLRTNPESHWFDTEQLVNALIRFHIEHAGSVLYQDFGAAIHVGLVGAYQHKAHYESHDLEKYLVSQLTDIRVVLNAIENSPSFAFSEITLERDLTEILTKTEKRANLRYQGEMYSLSTSMKYARSFSNLLTDAYRDQPSVSRRSFFRYSDYAKLDREYLAPESAPESSESRLGYLESCSTSVEHERGEMNRAWVDKLKNKSHGGQINRYAISHLDPMLHLDDPKILTFYDLGQIFEILDSPDFISVDLERSAFKIYFLFMLFFRRPFQFIDSIRVGTELVTSEHPMLHFQNAVIHYPPKVFFGRHGKLIDSSTTYDFYVRDDDGLESWIQDSFGYEVSMPFGSIPLHRYIQTAIEFYEELVRENLKNLPRPSELLLYQDVSGQLIPFRKGDARKRLKLLSQRISSDPRREISATIIHRTFDALFFTNGINCVDYYAVSERAKYAFEMPVRYTLRSLPALAQSFFSCCDAILRQIQLENPSLVFQYSDGSSLSVIPNTHYGSWHVIPRSIVRDVWETLSEFDAFEDEEIGLRLQQRKHNQEVRKAMFLLGLLLGLRDFEVPRIRRDALDMQKDTLRITGKGGKERELPLPAILGSSLARINKTLPKSRATLFSIYDGDEGLVSLRTSHVQAFFKHACHRIGHLALDFYGLRHRFRSDLCSMDVPDPVVNYLMGHGSQFVLDFSEVGLTSRVREIYQDVVQKLLLQYEIYGGVDFDSQH